MALSGREHRELAGIERRLTDENPRLARRLRAVGRWRTLWSGGKRAPVTMLVAVGVLVGGVTLLVVGLLAGRPGLAFTGVLVGTALAPLAVILAQGLGPPAGGRL